MLQLLVIFVLVSVILLTFLMLISPIFFSILQLFISFQKFLFLDPPSLVMFRAFSNLIQYFPTRSLVFQILFLIFVLFHLLIVIFGASFIHLVLSYLTQCFIIRNLNFHVRINSLHESFLVKDFYIHSSNQYTELFIFLIHLSLFSNSPFLQIIINQYQPHPMLLLSQLFEVLRFIFKHLPLFQFLIFIHQVIFPLLMVIELLHFKILVLLLQIYCLLMVEVKFIKLLLI